MVLAAGLVSCSLLEPYPDANVVGYQTSGSWALGQVVTATGSPLSGVVVTASTGGSANTDATGRFNMPLSATTVVLGFEHPDYAPAYRAHTLGEDGVWSMKVPLVPIDLETTIDVESSPASVQTPDGQLILEFPQGSLVYESGGGTPSGPVNISLTFLSRIEALENSPVPLQALDGGELTPLESYGMFDVQLSHNNQPVNVAPGMTVHARVKAQAGDPAAAGLFYASPTSALWELEGEWLNDGAEWTAELAHFSWVNIDGFAKVPPDERCCVTFQARDGAGEAEWGVEIKGTWDHNGREVRVAGYTNFDGDLCHRSFPCGKQVTITYEYFLTNLANTSSERTIVVYPSAQGVACGSADCETVELPLPCDDDDDCGEGLDCRYEICTPEIQDEGGDGDGDGDGDGSDACGGCPTGEVCIDSVCMPETEQTTCALREPSCCPGRDDACTAPGAVCFCDEYCQEAGDCCPDACNVCGFCG